MAKSNVGRVALGARWMSRAAGAMVSTVVLVVASAVVGCAGHVDDSRSDGVELEESVQPTLKITGTIVDADGRPLSGVTVQLQRASNAATTTASNGGYEFLGLHRGAYSIQPSVKDCTFDPPVVDLTGLKTDAVVDFRGAGPNCHGARDGGVLDGAVDAKAIDGAMEGAAAEAAVEAAADGPVDVCSPKTCQGVGVACGTVDDGCGSVLQCGSCPSGQTCSAQGQCVCQPITTCPLPAGKACGLIPNGCGGTLDCGACTLPDTCGGSGVPNVCGSEVGCDLDTLSCLRTRDKPNDPPTIQCSQCVRDNGCLDPVQLGGSCEDTPGVAPAACQSALSSATPVSETRLCLATLDQIFQSQCAATMMLTPCVCGSTDAGLCLEGTAAPNGPLLPIYECELGTTVPDISSHFIDQTRGAGQANALAQCAGAFGCDCF